MDANRERAVGRSGAGGAQGEPSYIWLRYSTQFTTGGRTHTIEMEVPVPVGASAEERERLIREAEANMEQLYRRVEGRARGQRPAETAQRPSHPPSTTPGAPVTTPGQASRRETQPEPTASTPSASAASAATTVPAPRESPQPLSLQDRRASSSLAGSQVPTARPGIAPELPVTPDLASSASGNMKLGEFIQIIRESWGITPKQALDLLQVKSLNNMNYRDLLRRLEPLVGQANGGSTGGLPSAPPSAPSQSSRPPATPTPAGPRRETGPKNTQASASSPAPDSTGRQPAPSPAPAARPASSGAAPPSPSSSLAGPANIPVYPLRDHTVREGGRAYRFDEEEEEEEQGSVGEVGNAGKAGQAGSADAGSTDEDTDGMSSALARIKIDDLRAIHGNTTASPGRINVLHNVLGDQISDDQFQELLERIWRTSSDKKLKQEQVEALISWAKEDYFEDEVRAVLAVLSEE